MLITLAIIGVVAAMTIPNLIVSYEKRVTEVRLQKAYATLSQLIKLSQIDHGRVKTWNTSLASNNKDNSKQFAEKYILPYLKGATYCDEGFEEGECAPYVGCGGSSQNYKLADGTMLGICAYINDNEVNLFISPRKDNNKFHSNFKFSLITVTGEFKPSYYDPQYDREDYLNGIHVDDEWYNEGTGYDVACTRDESIEYNAHACTALMCVDGFKIKDDYPW